MPAQSTTPAGTRRVATSDHLKWVWSRILQQCESDDTSGTRTLYPTARRWLTTTPPGSTDSPFKQLSRTRKAGTVPAELITALSRDDPARRAMLPLLARHPDVALNLARDEAPSAQPGSPPLADHLTKLAQLYDLVWQAALTAPEETLLIRSRLARARFLLTSISLRDTHDLHAWEALRAPCRRAQLLWLKELDNAENDPWLASRSGPELEQDLRDLVFRDDGTALVSQATSTGTLIANRHDTGVARRLVDGHLLPRADLCAVRRLAAAHDQSRTGRLHTTRAALLLYGPLIAAAVVTTAGLGLERRTWLPDHKLSWGPAGLAMLYFAATLVYGLGGSQHNPLRSRLLLARIPAGATLGLVTLLTLTPRWWSDTTSSNAARLAALTILVGAAIAYQAHELRNHGVTGRTLLGRTSVLVGIGLSYAALVCWPVLQLLAPLVIEDGEAFTGWWLHPWTSHTGHAAPLWILSLATAWSYAIGVFLQIVWDDRPITAPLGRTPRT